MSSYSSSLLILLAGMAAAQNSPSRGVGPATTPPPPNTHYLLRCGTVIDGVSAQPRKNTEIVIDGSKISEIRAASATSPGAQAIDLSRETCLPGLIDVHTHVLLQ